MGGKRSIARGPRQASDKMWEDLKRGTETIKNDN